MITELLLYADKLEARGDHERALAEYEELSYAGLGGAEPRARRDALLRHLGRADEIEDHPDATGRGGSSAFRLARLAFQIGRPWRAASHIQAALVREADTIEFRIMAAEIFMALEWFDRAFVVVRGLPDDMPLHWTNVRRHAEREYRRHHADALVRLRGFGEDPDRIRDIWELALALFKVGRVEAAACLCEHVMRERLHVFAPFEFYSKIVARQRGAAEAMSFLRAFCFLHEQDPDHARMMELMERQSERS